MPMSWRCRDTQGTTKGHADSFQVTLSPTRLSAYLSPERLTHFGGAPSASSAHSPIPRASRASAPLGALQGARDPLHGPRGWGARAAPSGQAAWADGHPHILSPTRRPGSGLSPKRDSALWVAVTKRDDEDLPFIPEKFRTALFTRSKSDRLR